VTKTNFISCRTPLDEEAFAAEERRQRLNARMINNMLRFGVGFSGCRGLRFDLGKMMCRRVTDKLKSQVSNAANTFATTSKLQSNRSSRFCSIYFASCRSHKSSEEDKF
jgi:hypothetical protein